MSSLTGLPAELFLQIISYIETSRDILYLSLTCRKANQVIEKDGYRVFVKSRFPSIAVPISADIRDVDDFFWKDGAHALTTLSRNWDRKAFIAQDIEPGLALQRLSNRGSRQTMGFTPVIDSHESWYGSGWCSRSQRVTWAAGAQLVFGSNNLGSQGKTWAIYHEDGTVDGRDDITSVQLSKPDISGTQKLVIGRANGDLAGICFDSQARHFRRHANFITNGKPVRSISMNTEGLLAACPSDNTLRLYDSSVDDSDVTPISSVEVFPSEKPGKNWVTRFLRHDRLAVGFGPSVEPIKVFDLNNGAGQHSLGEPRTLSIHRTADDGEMKATSIYSIAPLPASSLAGGFEGDLLLSGGYDGIVRLHDLRCSSSLSATFEDSVDYSPVYSLLPFGRERFVAGAAANMLIKVFDLRLPGGKRYYATDLHACRSTPQKIREWSSMPKYCCHYHDNVKDTPRGWNIFTGRGPSRKPRGRPKADVPIYSLSKPSEYSPTFFAGTENRVIQFDLVSVMDKHPDPIYGSVPRSNQRCHEVQHKWDANHRILSLPMYEHPEEHEPVKLRMQRDVGVYKAVFENCDERWS